MLLAAATLAVLQPASPATAEVRGMVYELANPKAPRDEWQRKPLANAYVVLSWSVTVPAPGHATSSCRHNEIARTDDQGQYVIEGPGFITAGLARPRVLVYAPGLERADRAFSGPALKEIAMARSTRSADERLDLLMLHESPGCFEREIHDPQGVLKAYYEALAAEARALVPTRQVGRNIQQMLEAKAKPRPPAGTVLRIEAAPVERPILQQRASPLPAENPPR